MRDADAWLVARTDDNGRRFLVSHGLDKDEAEALVARMEARGHKQSSWAERYETGCLDEAVASMGLLR